MGSSLAVHDLAERKIGNQLSDGAWRSLIISFHYLPTPSRGRNNCGGDWLIHTAGSQCQMALLPDTDHAVSHSKTETFAMEEVQPRSFTNSCSSNSNRSINITMAPHPSQRLHRPRRNHFHQLQHTSSATGIRQDVATGSSSYAGTTAATEGRTAAVEHHRRRFSGYWDFG